MQPITSNRREAWQTWALLGLTLVVFFLLLGSRSLNEPDEGRYAEIGREMIETGDWLVPHFWYVPHFDKPPMAYWLVAGSMSVFGQNEWAVRLPLALAGLSGVLAAWCLAKSLAGRRVAIWSVLILQSSLLYFAMARMLTTDLFLTQFNAWAVYCFWRGWLALREPDVPPRNFWPWHIAGWIAISLGFLTKGPVALAIPAVTLLLLIAIRWRTFPRKRLLLGGMGCGLVLFLGLAAPWFLAANAHIAHTLDYMVFHQAAGHVLGTTIRTRRGFPFYFFVILAFGFLPWSWLLGWLWRRAHWRQMPRLQQDGWLLLNCWAIFTFTLFSVTHSKLPAYILPIFPALAVMLALRFFREAETREPGLPPSWVWLLCAVSPLVLPAAFPFALPRLFHLTIPDWMHWQSLGFVLAGIAMVWLARKWSVPRRAGLIVTAALVSLLTLTAEAPRFETDFKANQTLKPLGVLLQENYHEGDALLCWRQIPEGLPFYAGGVISATNRPFLGGMNLTRLPFEFTGNQARMGDRLLTADADVVRLLTGERRVVVIIQHDTDALFQKVTAGLALKPLGKCGIWEMFATR